MATQRQVDRLRKPRRLQHNGNCLCRPCIETRREDLREALSLRGKPLTALDRILLSMDPIGAKDNHGPVYMSVLCKVREDGSGVTDVVSVEFHPKPSVARSAS